MTPILAADAAVLMSIFKPIVFAIVLGLWGAAVARIDKDLDYFFLPRRKWNLILISAGIVGFGLWVGLPSFWIGLPAALLVIGGSLVGYVQFRNGKVKDSERWTFDPKSWMGAKVAAARHAAAQEKAAIAFTTKAGVRVDVPTGDHPDTAAHTTLETILGFALPRGAQRLTVQIAAEKTAVSAEVDGVGMPGPTPEPKAAMAMLDYVKKHAKLDVDDRRRKQTGDLYIEAGEQKTPHLLRITTAGSTREIQGVMAIDPHKAVALRLDDLGLLPGQLDALRPVLKELTGTVIVAAPPGNGLRTTLYACLNKHDPYTQSVMTLEEEVIHEIEGVTHGTIQTGEGVMPVSEQLAVVIRRDPAIIMYPKLADVASAKLIAGSSHEVRFYAGMRQEDTFKALRAWIKAIGDPRKAADALSAVISSRLIRKLCENCRVAYTPDPAQLKKLNLPADRVTQLYKHSGKVQVKNDQQTCPACLGMGFRGRTGVYEVMVLDKPSRQLIAQGQLDQLRAHLRKQRMYYLQEAAIMRAVDGVTSMAEAMRALGGSS